MKPKCLWCAGTGETFSEEQYHSARKGWRGGGSPPIAQGFVACPLCDGTGRVPIVTWIGQKIALWRFKRRYG